MKDSFVTTVNFDFRSLTVIKKLSAMSMLFSQKQLNQTFLYSNGHGEMREGVRALLSKERLALYVAYLKREIVKVKIPF